MQPKSKMGTYLSIGGSLFAVISVAKQLREAREKQDALQLTDAVISAAGIVTGVALLARQLRRLNRDENDVLSD
ncbi:hypothetical protein [Streptomyces profundus]|uniref:hypothetical protein n=1 Tax=Streptomyces profundus TaxID=2867410 RepID=UPI001D1615AB|nr:hypothetical protein [Streptomyces sp. MA3_2.13]UED88655.1 hypothetical protein K4G22_23565 [Streptomyces sp. MA3_2.13]